MKFGVPQEGMQAHNTGTFGFSAVQLSNLGATEYTLVTLVFDVSGSTAGFQKRMENCLKEVLKACNRSPRKDNLMLRLVVFESNHREVHGFKLLADCKPSDYDNCLSAGGMTALYDACVDSIEATANFGHDLLANDYSANGLVVVVTDGEDNSSKTKMKHIKAAFGQAVRGENLESLLSILIGLLEKPAGVTDAMGKDPMQWDDAILGVPEYKVKWQYYNNIKDESGFTQFVAMDDAKDSTIARLAAFISKSVSSQSKVVGSGGVSQPVSF